MDRVVFSVIVPTYRDKRLNLCLSALVRQSFPSSKFEVIVVNNDPDWPISLNIDNYEKLNLKVLIEPIPGSYAARNKGILHASGEILAFTDTDCIPHRDWLKNAQVYFDKDIYKRIGILAGDVELFYRNSDSLSPAEIYEKYTGFTQMQYAKDGNCVTANWFSYKFIIDQMGGFDSQLKSNGDTDLSRKISNKYDVFFAPDVLVRHPARFYIMELVTKYRRLLGGAYARKFSGKSCLFLIHILKFSGRRLRFALKKSVTKSPRESLAIWKVCIFIVLGSWKEYFHLINKGETKR